MRLICMYPLAIAILSSSFVFAQGELGAPCQAIADSTSTGSTPSCDSGYCRNGGCSDPLNIVQLGDTCTNDNQCVNAETYAEIPASCAGLPGTPATCGGAGAFCYTPFGGTTGPSPVCASNACKNAQCAALSGIPAGGACTSTIECDGYASCLDGTCNDQGLPCLADDTTQTGPSTQCSTGYCRVGSCASFPASNLGEACSIDAACINAETFGETPASCAGVIGTQPTCGGGSASCLTLQGGFTGPSPVCASDICKNGQCSAVNGIAPGGSCLSSSECAGYANCLAGTCNDLGFPCSSSVDGSATGPSDQCDTGYCRVGSCASFPASNLGDDCSVDAACINAETFGETPAYCAGVSGTQPTCGGGSASCLTLAGGFTGPSPTCASNICKNGQCAALNGVAPGGSCGTSSECAGYSSCLDGTCNDRGFPCASSDGSATGPLDQCSTGYCRVGGCASFPSSDLGEPCSSDFECVGAEAFGETPAYCAGSTGVPATCGGGSASCLTLAGSFSGFSPTCASGQCLNGQCKRVDPVAPGQACQGSFDCGGGIFCINGFCTGGEDTCAATDGNGQAIGTSDDCTSGFCRAGQCSNVPTASLGDLCDEDRDCSGFEDNAVYRSLLNCGQAGSGTQRCGSGGQCLNYACTDVTPTPGLRKRVDFPAQQVIQKRLCPKGFEPCPLYPKGYECVDVMNDIESCGGCVGRNMPGIDCSADVHAAAVSCVGGHCEISACEMGYVVAAENNTCIAE